MPDITMCVNDKCELRISCYRYRAVPSEWHQSYSHFGGGLHCVDYWPLSEAKGRPIAPMDSDSD